jgi:hypothetical protein
MAASTVSREWLEWVGELAKGNASSSSLRPDPDRFACLLEDQPSTLVPWRFLRSGICQQGEVEKDGELIWNPACQLPGMGEIPGELERNEEWRDGFALGESATAWVRDEDRRQWRPFWLGEDLAQRCVTAQRSGTTSDEFSRGEQELLRSGGVLVSRAQAESVSTRWKRKVKRSRADFEQNCYCSAEELLHPFHIGEMRRYYRRLVRRGRVTLGDYQSARRYVAHNEPVARFFQVQLAGAVEQFVGEPVKPSYVYFASYQSGAKLKRHTDREQCEFSLTFCLDYSPEPEDRTPWPLHLDTPRGRVTVQQRLGDALLYRGRELPHWRDRLPDGHTSTSIFFHYVPANFSGSLT